MACAQSEELKNIFRNQNSLMRQPNRCHNNFTEICEPAVQWVAPNLREYTTNLQKVKGNSMMLFLIKCGEERTLTKMTVFTTI